MRTLLGVEQGEPGKPGTPGTPGTSADDYVVSVEEGESAYELVITYADGTKKTISMPKATSVVSGVKFIPTFLSEGEAARIHFPTIVTDSVAGKTEITGADWGTNNFSTSSQNTIHTYQCTATGTFIMMQGRQITRTVTKQRHTLFG